MYPAIALLLILTCDGLVNGLAGEIGGGVGVYYPKSYQERYNVDWRSSKETCRPEGVQLGDPVVITTMLGLKKKNPDGFAPRTTVVEIALNVTTGEGKITTYILDNIEMANYEDGSAQRSPAFFTSLFWSIRYSEITATTVKAGFFSKFEGGYNIPQCNLRTYTISPEAVTSDEKPINCDSFLGKGFKPSSLTYTTMSSTGGLDGAVGVSEPLTDYQKTLCNEFSASAPQVCRPGGAKRLAFALITKIKVLKHKDPNPFIPWRTVVDVELQLRTAGGTKTHRLDTFPLSNTKMSDYLDREPPAFLTPLFGSIKYRQVTEAKVEIGVFEVPNISKNYADICKLYTYKIPSAPGKEVERSIKYLKCKDWNGNAFKASSCTFTNTNI